MSNERRMDGKMDFKKIRYLKHFVIYVKFIYNNPLISYPLLIAQEHYIIYKTN